MFETFIKLFSHTSVGQGIFFVCNLLIAKFICLENYGLAACILSCSGFCTSIAACKYEWAILYEQDPKKQRQSITLSVFFILINSFVLSIVVFCLKNILIKGLQDEKIIFYLFFLILCSSLFELVTRNFYIHLGRFEELGNALFRNYLLRATMPFLLLFFLHDWRVCILGEILSYAISCSLFLHKNFSYIFKNISIKECCHTAKELRFYPQYQMPSSMIDQITFSSIIPSINFLFNNSIAGQFSILYRTLLIPISLLNGNLGAIYQRSLVTALKLKSLLKTFCKYSLILFLLGPLLYGGFFVCILFFKKFIPIDISYILPILLLCLSQFIGSTLSIVLLIQKDGLIYHIIYKCVNLICFIIIFLFSYLAKINAQSYINVLCTSLIATYVMYYLLMCYYVRNFRYSECTSE